VFVVYKRSNLEAFVRKWGEPTPRQRRVLEKTFRAAHNSHAQTMKTVRQTLSTLTSEVTYTRRENLSEFDERDFDFVLTVGGDGTLLAAATFLSRTPVLAVNSAPFASVGFFAAAGPKDVRRWLHAIANGRVKPSELWRLRVHVNGQSVGHPALNDVLVCHPHPVITTRVALKPPGARVYEEQKSSGVWISTPAGSSSAARAAGGKLLPLYSQQLQYVVREPYVTGKARYQNVRGIIEHGKTLHIASRLPNARAYIDGTAYEAVIGFGDELTFSVDPMPLRLFGRSPIMNAVHGLPPETVPGE
jgi:NAD+ kinase